MVITTLGTNGLGEGLFFGRNKFFGRNNFFGRNKFFERNKFFGRNKFLSMESHSFWSFLKKNKN